MKSANTLKTILTLALVLTPTTYILATDLDSTNYRIVGATTSGGGGIQESTNYSVLSSVGDISADPRNYSTNYQLNQDPSSRFVAAKPTIQCFETTTDGTTNCTSGPDELLSGGMVAICGPGGCYNKGRFEMEGVSRAPDVNTVGFWSLDEETGAGAYLLDSSSQGNHGTPSGTTYTDGVISGARSFDGTDDYINVGQDSSLDLTTSGTISLWAKTDRAYPSDDTNPKWRGLIAKTVSGGAGDQSYWIDWNGTNSTRKLRLGVGDDTALQSISLLAFDFSNEWVHIAFTFDNSNLVAYVNGSEADSVPQTITPQILAQDVHIGRAFSSQNYSWEGEIDDVYISNRALSADEILSQYEYGTGKRSNPSDTLYSIEISTDNFASDIQYIDGSTFRPESAANHDINDYRTETYWETETFNVKGLNSSTQYYIRAKALHGDFTQSDASFSSTATTAGGTLSFDIDIATSGGIDTETSSPYSIAFTGAYELVGGAAAITAPNLVWLDIESSSAGGVAVLQHGENGGLYSATTTQTITSATADLDQVDAGFGLQSYYIDYDTSPFYGDLTATTNYSGSTNNVGIVEATNNKIYDGDGPISSGRVGIELIAKAGTDKTSATDYTENIHFVLVPRY